MEELRRWIKARFKPKVFIATSFEAKNLLLKNGLTPTEFVEPFCTITQPFTFKSVNFTRFYLTPVDNFAGNLGDNVLEASAPPVDWHGTYVTERSDVDQFLSEDRTPWYQVWKDRFMRTLSYCLHELIDMPLAAIFIASTSDVDPANTFQIITKTLTSNEPYTRAVYNNDIPKCYILLHDQSGPPSISANIDEVIKQTSRQFNYCVGQRINSGEAPSEIWGEKGQLISRNEASQIQMIFNEILTRHIVPFVQEEIRRIEAIEREKRGFGSKLSRFFGGSKSVFNFTRGQSEHNMRILADYSFMFADYDSALKYYRDVVKDFKEQRAYRQAAGALEMQAICIAIQRGDFRSVENLMEEAYRHYALAEDAQLQIRSTLIAETMFTCYDQPRRLADKLIRVGNEVGSTSEVRALFYEQASMCFLRMKPAFFRKFAFYQVLAGEDYTKHSFRRNAIHCYFSSIQLYAKKNWRSLELPLNQMLGKISYHMGLALESVHFLLKVVGSDKLIYKDDHSQKKVINELIGTIAHWVNSGKSIYFDAVSGTQIEFAADSKPILPFGLPQMLNHAAYLANESKQQASLDAMTVSWASLLEKMSKTAALKRDIQSMDIPRTTFKSRKLFVEDSIDVKLTLYNPLKIVLVIEQVQLIAAFEDNSSEGIEVQVIDRIDLPHDNKATFMLRVTPKVPGNLTIKAVRWKIFNVFHGRCDLTPVLPFEVLPQVSRLTASFEGFPQVMLHGQVCPLTLVLTNQGPNDVDAIEFSTSHNTFFGFTNKSIDLISQGQSQRIQIWVRGDIIGRHCVRVLVCYTSCLNKLVEGLELPLEVRPSIRVVHKYGPSLRCIEENMLCLSVYKELAGKVLIKQLSSLTPHSLRLIQKFAGDRYFFAVKGGEPTDLSMEDSLITDEFDVRHSFIVDMLKASPRVIRENPVDLVLLWESTHDGVDIKGVHFLPSLSFSVNSVDKLPLHLTLEAPNSFNHDFTTASLCTFPVVVKIKNLQSKALDFKIEACDNDCPISEKENPLPPHFFWRGIKQTKFSGLESNVSPRQAFVTMQLSACFLAQGTYDLSRFKITIYRDGVIQTYSSEINHWVELTSANALVDIL